MNQNINIIYKVDSKEVESSTASVQKAKAATDQLQNSAQKTGSAINQEFQKSNKTILDMQTALTRLKSVIEVTSNPAKLKQLGDEYKNIKKQLDEATKSAYGLGKANSSVNTETGNLTKTFGNLFTAVKAVIGAQIAKQFVSAAIEAAELSGKVEGVERAFKRAFPSGELILNDLRKATRGTITDFELMQRTLQATNLGVAVEQLPVLFEFAAARAQQTGESVDYLVDSIVRGIGRKSPLILDNLGLSAVRLKEQFNGAALASQSVADVTAAVGRIAQEELGKMGGFADTTSTKVDRLKVSWENLKLGISQIATQEGGLIDYFNGLIKKASDFVEIQKRGITSQQLYHEKAVEEAATTAVNIIKQNEYNKSQEKYLSNIRDVIAMKTHELIQQQEELKLREKNRLTILQTKNPFSTTEGANLLKNEEASIKNLKVQNELYIKEIQLLNGLAKSLDVKKIIEEEETGIIQRKREEIKAIQEQLESTNNKGNLGVGGALVVSLKRAQDELDVLLGKEKKVTQELTADQKAYLAWFDKEMDFVMEDLNEQAEERERIAKETAATLLKEEKERIDRESELVDAQFEKRKQQELELQKLRRHLADGAIGILEDQLISLASVEADNAERRIGQVTAYYDKQLKLAGDNDAAKAQIEKNREIAVDKARREAFRKQKDAQKKQAIINAAGAAARAFVDYEYPVSIAIAALAAAQALSQVAIIDRQQPAFKDGVIDLKGPGTGTSDSINARLSRGESVMTAKETDTSGKTLRMIRAKKLNDKILDKIMLQSKTSGATVGFDDSRLLKATERVEKAAKGNDIVRKGMHIYEAVEQGRSLKRYARSKSLN